MIKYTVTKEFNVSVAHRLMHYKGVCNNLHGHNYKIQVSYSATEDELDEEKFMVVDFAIIKKEIGGWLDKYWDHATLYSGRDQDIRALCHKLQMKIYSFVGDPTAENMCRELLEVFPTIDEVKIYETDTSFASAKRVQGGCSC